MHSLSCKQFACFALVSMFLWPAAIAEQTAITTTKSTTNSHNKHQQLINENQTIIQKFIEFLKSLLHHEQQQQEDQPEEQEPEEQQAPKEQKGVNEQQGANEHQAANDQKAINEQKAPNEQLALNEQEAPQKPKVLPELLEAEATLDDVNREKLAIANEINDKTTTKATTRETTTKSTTTTQSSTATPSSTTTSTTNRTALSTTTSSMPSPSEMIIFITQQSQKNPQNVARTIESTTDASMDTTTTSTTTSTTSTTTTPTTKPVAINIILSPESGKRLSSYDQLIETLKNSNRRSHCGYHGPTRERLCFRRTCLRFRDEKNCKN